jgi:hypothetical protein
MSVAAASRPRPSLAPEISSTEKRHRSWVSVGTALAFALVLWLAVYGMDYYTLDQAHRVISPKHAALKPSGTIGLRLGMFGVALFLLIYLYAVRKRWAWLSRQGNTRHWLNFHILLGITAPLIITFHAAFKFGGIAGVAYWIMMAVVLSGFVGRYIYSLIPHSLGAAEISLKELRAASEELARQLGQQKILSPADLAPLFRLPDPAKVQRMTAPAILWMAMRRDLALPFHIRKLRRKAQGSHRGTLARQDLEEVIDSVKMQASLSKKVLFLSKMQEIFRLWHVIHRPFSYSFAILAGIHIVVVLLFGYF